MVIDRSKTNFTFAYYFYNQIFREILSLAQIITANPSWGKLCRRAVFVELVAGHSRVLRRDKKRRRSQIGPLLVIVAAANGCYCRHAGRKTSKSLTPLAHFAAVLAFYEPFL